MHIDLVVLTLILAASHWATDRPIHAGGPGMMKTTGQHHLQRAETKSCGPKTRQPPAPGCPLEILSIKIMNRTGVKGQPAGIQHVPGTVPTY